MELEHNIDYKDYKDEDSKSSKQKQYEARRKIEDWAEIRRMRSELGIMGDLGAELGDIC